MTGGPITESGDPRDRITNQLPLPPARVTGPGPIDTIREACHRCGSKPSAETRSERHGQDWCNVCWDRVQPPPSAILAALMEVEHQLAAADIKIDALRGKWNEQTERAKAAEQRANDLADALRDLASWQPSTPAGLDALHPQHIEAIVDARAALDRREQP